MFKFIHTPNGEKIVSSTYDSPTLEITRTIREHCTLEEMLVEYEYFLRGCGYVIDGQIEVVEDGVSEFTPDWDFDTTAK